MALEIVEGGNLFATECPVLVNTVNTVGVMGAGVALECRLRYPEMFRKYRELCGRGLLDIGKLWLYQGGREKGDVDDRKILCFPTKKDWRLPSKMEYVEAGLKKFAETYRERGISGIAFPILGGQNGKLDPGEVLALMRRRLAPCAASVDIKIYRYDPRAKDDLFDRFSRLLFALPEEEWARRAGVAPLCIRTLREELRRPGSPFCQMGQLAKIRGVGTKTLEKLFRLLAGMAPPGEGLPAAIGREAAERPLRPLFVS